MANKKTREENLKKDKLKRYDKALKKLDVYPLPILVGLIITILLFFVKFGYIHNTDMNNGAGGTEVFFNGFNLFFAGLTGKFSSAEKLFGDIAIPFYYYAESYIETLSVLMILLVFISLIAIITSVVCFFTKKHVLSAILVGLNLIVSCLLLIIFIKALSMTNSEVLPIYCGGNPACSIRSNTIIPFIISCLSLGFNVFYLINFIKIRKILN